MKETTAKKKFMWNMAGSLCNSLSSMLLLIIVNRISGESRGGFFALAYSTAQLLFSVGGFEIRPVQSTDIKNKFTFNQYFTSRMLNCIIMLICMIGYIVVNGYTGVEALTVFWILGYRMVEAVADVYSGLFQQRERIDISGKEMLMRSGISTITFTIILWLTDNLLYAAMTLTLTSLVIMLFYDLHMKKYFEPTPVHLEWRGILGIYNACWPLFVSSFIMNYLNNAPKYAIDSLLSDEMQACYGFIAMPVFVIGLLNNFIFSPMIARMSMMWKERQNKDFFRLFWIQILIIGIITIVCEAGAFVLGVPVLSMLYNTDLAPYKTELLVLLLGGGFLALSGLFVTIMTIIRIQNSQAIGYGIVAVCAYILSPIFVRKYAVMGASVLYLLLMILLCIIFAIMMMIGFKKKRSDA